MCRTGEFDPNNPFTPDILVFDKNGNKIGGPLAKPSAPGGGLQPSKGRRSTSRSRRDWRAGGCLRPNSNQATHANGQNNSSRIVIVNPNTGQVRPFITCIADRRPSDRTTRVQGEWIYWSQGSTTNSGVVGLDNGGGQNQSDIPCQTITSATTFLSSGGGMMTSGYSPFGVTQPAGHDPGLFQLVYRYGSSGRVRRSHLRARLVNPSVIQPVGWGYRNGYAIRFRARGSSVVRRRASRRGWPDERGARPSNGAPEGIRPCSPEPRRQPGLPWLAGPLWGIRREPGGLQPGRRAERRSCDFDATNLPSR